MHHDSFSCNSNIHVLISYILLPSVNIYGQAQKWAYGKPGNPESGNGTGTGTGTNE